MAREIRMENPTDNEILERCKSKVLGSSILISTMT